MKWNVSFVVTLNVAICWRFALGRMVICLDVDSFSIYTHSHSQHAQAQHTQRQDETIEMCHNTRTHSHISACRRYAHLKRFYCYCMLNAAMHVYVWWDVERNMAYSLSHMCSTHNRNVCLSVCVWWMNSTFVHFCLHALRKRWVWRVRFVVNSDFDSSAEYTIAVAVVRSRGNEFKCSDRWTDALMMPMTDDNQKINKKTKSTLDVLIFIQHLILFVTEMINTLTHQSDYFEIDFFQFGFLSSFVCLHKTIRISQLRSFFFVWNRVRMNKHDHNSKRSTRKVQFQNENYTKITFNHNPHEVQFDIDSYRPPVEISQFHRWAYERTYCQWTNCSNSTFFSLSLPRMTG